ncbi:MAG: hypothetical protein R3Y43_02955 [Alphaproteobacteria bacterium]
MRKKSYQQKRQQAYEKELPIGEQLDAILKAFDMVLQDGAELPYELIDVIERWQDIKEKYPKK